MPCFSRMRWDCRPTSPSMPGRMRSRNSTTVTSAPSRRHTEPSSSPITPAPTTSSRFGTLSSARRRSDDDDALLVDRRRPAACATSEPVAMTMFLVSSVCVLPSAAFTSTLPGAGDAAGAVERIDLVLLEQELDALDVAVDALVLELHHRGEIELRRADLDAHLGEARGRPPRTARRRAAAPSTGCSRRSGRCRRRSRASRPRDLQAELRRADGADIAAGAGADDDEIVGHDDITPVIGRHGTDCRRRDDEIYKIQHQPRRILQHSFTRTRKVTASRPSTMR